MKTKQEEIKKRLLELANENYILRPTGVSYQECMVDDMLRYLNSQGVVIKYEKCIGQDSNGHNYYEDVVEPLIEV